MATTDSLFTEFFNTIGSTSAFEAIRKVQKVDGLALAKELKFDKFSDLGTPVIDYVELTLYDENRKLYCCNPRRCGTHPT